MLSPVAPPPLLTELVEMEPGCFACKDWDPVMEYCWVCRGCPPWEAWACKRKLVLFLPLSGRLSLTPFFSTMVALPDWLVMLAFCKILDVLFELIECVCVWWW